MSDRLELVALGRAFLASWLAGERPPDLGFTDPQGFLVGAEDVVRLRLAQLDAHPKVEPWLLRAIVLRDTRVAVGFLGFHAEPDARGMVEIGYEVHPAFRMRGYASEAVAALLTWAAQQGAQVARASIGPDNVASLAVVKRQGFVLVGEQLDEEDGPELVFEKPLDSVCVYAE